MSETVLQHLVLSGREEFEGLYSAGRSEFPVRLGKGEVLDLRAHFNYLDCGRITKFTAVSEVSLILDFEGSLSVSVYSLNGGDAALSEIEDAVSGRPMHLPIYRGTLGIAVTGREGGCVLRAGRFIAKADSVRKVTPALVICTYLRETEVVEKVRRVRTSESIDQGGLRIIITDNGRTIGPSIPGAEVFPSENYGGSAGYARGILEAMKDPEVTHIILNDDDAEFDPEIIFRAVSFCSVLKDGFSNTVLGATMLEAGRPSIVSESGARYLRTRVRAFCRGLDVRLAEDNQKLSEDREIDYFGWWYCCLPVGIFSESGLPLPLFFKYDDVEFGLRISAPKTAVCGISVWHPSFDSKYSSVSVYYSTRNLLVAGCTSGRLRKEDLGGILRSIETDIAGYRYLSAEAGLRAVDDFLEGPDAMFGRCLNGPEEIEEYVSRPVEELREGLHIGGGVSETGKTLRMVLLNGLLLPSKGDVVSAPASPDTSEFYRVGNVLYDLGNGLGILCTRSRRRTIGLCIRFLRTKRRLFRSFDRVSKEYRDSFAEYSSSEHWKKVFGE